jgi:hypothetical protein
MAGLCATAPLPEQGIKYKLCRIDGPSLQQLWSRQRGRTVLERIALIGLIIVVGMLLLAAQRYFANKRLATKRRNKDES